jgi:glycosyltransferase involved in cell wall biosynthesis
LRKELVDLACSLGIEDSVIFAGNQNQEWLAKVLPKANAIVSPHMGRALTEAALAGVPIIAYDYDWQRELVIDGETGFLVPHKDWIGLANKTEHVLTNPELASKFGENVRNKVLEMMNPERLEQHEQNEYTKLLNRFKLCSKA